VSRIVHERSGCVYDIRGQCALFENLALYHAFFQVEGGGVS
jgi:hypothetical protein